jgi:hypothetical protein
MQSEEEKIKQFQKEIEEFEKKQAQKAEIFDPVQIIKDAGEIHILKDPKLGVIRYTPLTNKDLFAINKIQDKEARTREIIFRLLHKASPELKVQDVDEMPMAITTRLLELLVVDEDFLKTSAKLANGSKQAKTHK